MQKGTCEVQAWPCWVAMEQQFGAVRESMFAMAAAVL